MDIKVGDIVRWKYIGDECKIFQVTGWSVDGAIVFGYELNGGEQRNFLQRNITHVNGVPVAAQEDDTFDWEVIACEIAKTYADVEIYLRELFDESADND